MSTRKAKIVCTIGPTSQSEEMLIKLIKSGLDVARLNFSHGTHEDHLKSIKLIRKLSEKLGKPISILQDLQGPKIRVGKFKNPPIALKTGAEFIITTRKIEGNAEEVGTSYKNLPNDVEIDDNILINDGLIKLKVIGKNETDVKCRVIVGGPLYDHKGVNLPGVKISEPSLTAKDREDLSFGIAHDVDYVALSFVRDADSIYEIKKIIGDKKIPVVAKLEKPEALDNLEAIVEATDVVMVARGDLGVEISTQKVPVVQKRIIELCQKKSVPVITATQMLDSMIVNPTPTRAEATDVANAVFDGTDAVMLSGETAFGKYPLEAVQMMDSIVREAEAHTKYFRLKHSDPDRHETVSFSRSICDAAYHSAVDISAKLIVVFSESGYTAKEMSKLRPQIPIVALTTHKNTLSRLPLIWGALPLYLDRKIKIESNLKELENFLKSHKLVKKGDKIVIIAGFSMNVGGTNLLRLHEVV